VGTGAYSYSMNGGGIQASGTFNNLIAGTYTVIITMRAGCSGTITVVLSVGGVVA